MRREAVWAAIARFLAGWTGTAAAGLAVTSLTDLFPWARCLAVGVLVSAVLSLVRTGMPRQALLVIAGATALQVGAAVSAGPLRAAGSGAATLALGSGVFAAGVVFDRLAVMGLRSWKFLVVGPLMAGMYAAVSPLTLMGDAGALEAFRTLSLNALLGILIGTASGLGIEIADHAPMLRRWDLARREIT
jgi:hypothetical protein